MKHFCITLLMLNVTTLFCLGQDAFYNKVDNENPNAFFVIGAGINHTGTLSIGVDIPVTDKFSVFCNLGAGGWGVKFGAGVSYNFNNIKEGSTASFGIYSASGSADGTVPIINEAGNEIPVFLNPVATLNATYSYNIKIGKKHKLAFVVGYAAAIADKDESYEIFILSAPFDEVSKESISFLHPDGVILGIKLMFGMGNRQY